MARTPQRVVERNLLKVPVLIEDTVSYSKYFEVSRLNPNFHAGKNGFLIRGTQYLKNGTSIQVEVLDRYGKTVFSNVIGNYSEGDARLVSVEITQKTRKGPGKLVVVGTATNYEDGRPIPSNQQNSPNVRWVFPIDIDPSRRNTSKLILQNSPARILNGLSVTRTDFNTTSRTDAFVTSSTYTASLDYDFEGHRSDGYAITMVDSSGTPTPFFDDVSIDGYFTGSLYKREIRNLYDTGVLVPDSQSIVLDYVTASVYTPLFKTLNETLAITEKSIKFGNGDDYLNPVLYSGSYSRVVTEDDLGGNLVRKIEEEITSSVIFEYPTETLTTSANNSSILNFRIPYTQTYSGEIAKVRISAKEANPEITAWNLLTEFNPTERNILITGSNTGNVSVGRFLTNDRLQNHWQSGLVNITDYENSQSASPITLVTSSAEILEGFYADHTESAVSYYFGTQEFYQLYKGVQYTLKYDAVYNPTYVSSSTTYSTTDTGSVKAYLTRIGSDAESKASSSVVIATKDGVENTYGNLLDTINTRDSDKALYERQVNFTPERDGVAYLRFIVDSGFWNFSNFVITPAIEYGYNPDEIVVYAEDTILTGTTYLFRIEFIGWAGDISDEFISDPIDIPPKGGGASLRLITDRTVFTFDSLGDPFPTAQTASVEVILVNVTDTPTFTLVDDFDVPVDTQFYSVSNGNLNFDIYVGAFGAQTASINPNPTSSLLLTVSASAGGDIVQDKLRFVRAKDAADGTPGAPGATGEGARAVKLTLSDYSVVYEQGGINPTPTSITASATAQNLEGNAYVYNFYRTGSFLTRVPAAGTTTDTSATASFLVPPTDDYKQQNIEVQVSESLTGVARDIEDFVGVTPGEDGWSIILTNTSHTLPADNDGIVTSYVGSGTKIEILKGANNLLPWTGSAPPPGYFTASVFESSSIHQPDKTGSVALLGGEPTYIQFADLPDPDGMEQASDLGTITYYIAANTSSAIYEFYQVQSFSKSKQGDPGSNGSGSRAVKLTLSDYSIIYSEFGDNPDPTSVTASAYHQNLEAPVTFSFYLTGSELITHSFASVPEGPVTTSFAIPPTDNYTAHLVEVSVSESANGVAFDSNEYFGITPGVDGWTIIFSNENHTFPADADGTVNNNYAGGGTDIEVLYGATNFIPETGSTLLTGQFSASIYESSSILADYLPVTASQIYLRYGDNPPNNMIADNASITYKITAVSGSQTFEFYKKQSFTKSKKGENAFVYYITPLDGLQFKTNAQGTTTPEKLYFQTQRSNGNVIEDVPSGSFDGEQFGLFFSGSNLPLSGSGPDDPGGASSYYTASADDIFERAVIRFLTGSGAIGSRYIADSVSVQDLSDGLNGISYQLIVDGAISFNSSSIGISPTTTSSITGSLIQGGVSIASISSSITPSSTNGLTVNAVGSSSADVSSSWTVTNNNGSTNLGYQFKFISQSVVVGVQDFNISTTEIPAGNIIFTVNPSTQVICRDYNDNIINPIPSVVVTGSEGQNILAFNDPTPTTGEWNFIDVYGIPSKSNAVGNPISWTTAQAGAGGQIDIDYTKIKLTGSLVFTVYADIRFTSSLGVSGSRTESFTLTKQNCYDPCSPTVVELDRYNQTVNSITGSLQAPPENFKAIVTQDGDQLTYQSGVSSESTFDYLYLSQSNSTAQPTDNGNGTITPAAPSTLNTSEVHALVRYKDNCGITATFPATHSINVIFEGAVGPGVVVTGIWTGSQAYVVQNDQSGGIRDVVLWWSPQYAADNGTTPGDPLTFNGYPIDDADTEQYMISYYAAIKTHTSIPSGSGGSEPSDTFNFGPPHISTGSNAEATDPAWEYLGDEERFVAAKIGIFRESFIWNTLNVGTNTTTQSDPNVNNVKANITLAGGTKNPYISIGQTIQDYGEGGVFIGSGSAAKLSLSGSEGGLFWDGSTLDVDGTISASLGYFYGGVSIETGGSIYSGQTAWNTGTGFWLESNSGTPRLSIGNSGGGRLTWDGTNLNISGSISASSGYFSGSLYAIGGKFAQSVTVGDDIVLDGQNTKIYVGAGNYDNIDTSFYVDGTDNFSLGNKLTWDGSALDIDGVISASAGLFSGTVTVGPSDDVIIGPGTYPKDVGAATYFPSSTSPLTINTTGTNGEATFTSGILQSYTSPGDSRAVTFYVYFTNISGSQNAEEPYTYLIDDLILQVTQSNYYYAIPLQSIDAFVNNEYFTTASVIFYTSGSSVIQPKISGRINFGESDSNVSPAIDWMDIGISASYKQSSIAINESGIFMDRGNGRENILALTGGGGGGTITGVTAGSGLTGGGTAGNVTIALDPTSTFTNVNFTGQLWGDLDDKGNLAGTGTETINWEDGNIKYYNVDGSSVSKTFDVNAATSGNAKNGASYVILFRYGGGSGITITWTPTSGNHKWVNGTAPNLSDSNFIATSGNIMVVQFYFLGATSPATIIGSWYIAR